MPQVRVFQVQGAKELKETQKLKLAWCADRHAALAWGRVRKTALLDTLCKVGGRVYTKQMPSKKRDLFDPHNTYFLCSFREAALSFSWLAQHGWISQEHGIMF
jgi:hypothetical protein